MALKIYYTSDFRKAYRKLPRFVQNLIDRKDSFFRENPSHPGLRTHKLRKPLEGFWSFWITGSYRVMFEYVKGGAIFHDVGTHDIYR